MDATTVVVVPREEAPVADLQRTTRDHLHAVHHLCRSFETRRFARPERWMHMTSTWRITYFQRREGRCESWALSANLANDVNQIYPA